MKKKMKSTKGCVIPLNCDCCGNNLPSRCKPPLCPKCSSIYLEGKIKKCIQCMRWLNYLNFYFNKKNLDGLTRRCIGCGEYKTTIRKWQIDAYNFTLQINR